MSAKSTVTGRSSSSNLMWGRRGGRPVCLDGLSFGSGPCKRCNGIERVVLPQDRLFELTQLRGGLEPELLVEELSERSIRLESVSVPTGR